jgi:nucleoside-diphosphate-sugar epimerase
MKVLVAGSSGVIGRQAVELLTQVGHEVVELVRPGGMPASGGPDAAVADALDAPAVRDAVGRVEPDAVVDLLTAIPRAINPRRMAHDMALTNRLRTEGLANLIAAAPDARFVVESLAYAYAPTGGALADEDQPLWIDGPRQFRPVAQALVEHERLAGEVDAATLRFGHLYGPGSSYASDGSFVEQVRAGKVPIVGDGGAVFSFTHAHDAATAVVAALDKSFRGVVNVVDDDPTPLRTWLPELADLVGAPAPRKVPKAMARMAVGGWGVAFMTALPGADNSRARLHLDWRPGHPSWKKGFEHELRATARDGGVDL